MSSGFCIVMSTHQKGVRWSIGAIVVIHNITFCLALLISSFAHAEMTNILVEKVIDDDNIIIATESGERLLLEKWTTQLSPLSLEGEYFPADVSALWVKIFIEGKGEIKWSVEKELEASETHVSSPCNYATYKIDNVSNDETFVISGKTFGAKIYCRGWKSGERIRFIEGSHRGVCVGAKILNLDRNETCEVWCE